MAKAQKLLRALSLLTEYLVVSGGLAEERVMVTRSSHSEQTAQEESLFYSKTTE